MGWWGTKRDDVVIGDKAADILEDAIVEIQGVYSSDLKRKATRLELVALMRFCCGDVSNGVVRLGRESYEDNHSRQPAQAEGQHQERDERPYPDSQDVQG